MIAVDTNVLVPLVRTEYPHHETAFARVRALAEGSVAWAIPWPCVHEFLAVVTNPRIFRTPLPPADAITAVEALFESPSLQLLSEVAGYWPVARSLMSGGTVLGGRIHDARIAALCLAHGVDELWTADRDFSRFPQLRVRNPFA